MQKYNPQGINESMQGFDVLLQARSQNYWPTLKLRGEHSEESFITGVDQPSENSIAIHLHIMRSYVGTALTVQVPLWLMMSAVPFCWDFFFEDRAGAYSYLATLLLSVVAHRSVIDSYTEKIQGVSTFDRECKNLGRARWHFEPACPSGSACSRASIFDRSDCGQRAPISPVTRSWLTPSCLPAAAHASLLIADAAVLLVILLTMIAMLVASKQEASEETVQVYILYGQLSVTGVYILLRASRICMIHLATQGTHGDVSAKFVNLATRGRRNLKVSAGGYVRGATHNGADEN